MEILIIRHAECQSNTGITESLDSALTDYGMSQACITGKWLAMNLKLDSFVGYTSPYLRTIQTASVISELAGVQFTVHSGLREYRFIKKGPEVKDNGINVLNRSIAFQNITWPLHEWKDNSNFIPSEDINSLIDRSMAFIVELVESHIEKTMIITHSTPGIVLSKLISGQKRKDIKQECEEALEIMKNGVKKSENPFIGGFKNCGMTYLKNDEMIWSSKVVYK